jgi:hypothetical protein
MIYQTLPSPPGTVIVSTHERARRGRGVLFATAPYVIYLGVLAVLFAIATTDLTVWLQVKQSALFGLFAASAAAGLCFLLGFRIIERLEVNETGLVLTRRPALGPVREIRLPVTSLVGFAIEPSLRSLGADVLLVAVTKDLGRIPLLEGEPHSAQVRELAGSISQLTHLPLEAPRCVGPH